MYRTQSLVFFDSNCMPITKPMGDGIWILYNSHTKLSPKEQRGKIRDEIGFLSPDCTHSRNEEDALVFISVLLMGRHVVWCIINSLTSKDYYAASKMSFCPLCWQSHQLFLSFTNSYRLTSFRWSPSWLKWAMTV